MESTFNKVDAFLWLFVNFAPKQLPPRVSLWMIWFEYIQFGFAGCVQMWPWTIKFQSESAFNGEIGTMIRLIPWIVRGHTNRGLQWEWRHTKEEPSKWRLPRGQCFNNCHWCSYGTETPLVTPSCICNEFDVTADHSSSLIDAYIDLALVVRAHFDHRSISGI